MSEPGFEVFRFNKQVLDAIREAGFIKPTPIQQKVIPQAMAGHDLLGIAPTGTGKTAAYLLPLIMKLSYPQELSPRALTLVPTRELAIQIGKEFKKFAVHTGLRAAVVYGGTGMKSQLDTVREGIDILIATPGRFMDVYRTGELITKKIRTLVLDEADKMMDMGFMPQIRSILEVIPSKNRQNLLFSATFHQKIDKLSAEFLEFPLRIEATPQATPAATIEQRLYKLPNLRAKINFLEYLLLSQDFEKVIIFAKTRNTATNIFKFLHRKVDKRVRVIHANKDQNARINAMESFSKGETRILVSTDVTSRGIDISMVSHVINFDVPVNYEDYIHRIGRTGRALNSGIAITLVNPPDDYHIAEVEKLIRNKIPVFDIPPEIEIPPTDHEESQEQAREIDKFRRKKDPSFKGAFHEKKIISKDKSRPRKKH